MLNRLITFTKNDAVRRTFGYYFLFICLGLTFAISGPTLGSLGLQTGTGKAEMGLLFLSSSIGYTLGTILSGRVFDHVRGHPILGLAELFVAVSLFLIPLTPWLWLLLLIVACQGFAGGFINTGGNILLVWTHGEKVGPFMNGLHFFFGLGATLSPFLVALITNLNGSYRLAYWILAAFTLLVALRMLTLKGDPQPTHTRTSTVDQAAGGRVPYGLVVTAMLFLFFYVGAEITFGGWIHTYAVTLDLASAAGAAYLTSAFWFAFTAGRLLSIPIATRFKPAQVILTASIGCLCILAAGMFFAGSSIVLWMLAIGLGFCMAPIWPTGFTLAGQSVYLTGRLTGVILLGDSFGGMVLPSLTGKVIESVGAPAMVYLVFGSLVLNLLAFAGMLRLRPAKASVKI